MWSGNPGRAHQGGIVSQPIPQQLSTREEVALEDDLLHVQSDVPLDVKKKKSVLKFTALGTLVLMVTGCAGPRVERARFRIASLAGKPPVPMKIDRAEFSGPKDSKGVQESKVTNEGNRILRDKVLVDVAIAKAVDQYGVPEAIELRFTHGGQVQWFTLFYKDPPHTLVFRRSLADVQWLSIRELEESRLMAELDTIPRSVRRLAFGEDPLPPPWPVTISLEQFEAFDVPVPTSPPTEVDAKDYMEVANTVQQRLSQLPPPNAEVCSLAEKAFTNLRNVTLVPGISWRLVVFSAEQPVAFGIPEGTVFVSDSLVSRLSEVELTALLAHVMAHQWHQHGQKLASKAGIIGALLLVSSVAQVISASHPGATGGPAVSLLLSGYTDVLTNPNLGYSRKHEVEANCTAAEILKKLDIPPDKLFDALVKFVTPSPKTPKSGSLAIGDVHRLGRTTRDLGILLDGGKLTK